MARKLRWQLQFKSFKNVDVTVNIYKEGYLGTTVTQLVGAANPIYWEEDDDESYHKWVRYKTGYLSVIEQETNDLFDIYPSYDTEHYIEVYYGELLEFIGYIQAEAYNQPFVAGPKEIQLPIVSPLALCESMNFDTIETSMLTPGECLKMIIDKLNVPYEKIMYPAEREGENFHPNRPWNSMIQSEVICPHNNAQPSRLRQTAEYLYQPQTLMFFLDSFLCFLGWTVHECGTQLLFVKEDFNGNYNELNVSDLSHPTTAVQSSIDGSQVLDLASHFIACDSNAEVSHQRPYHKVTVKIEDDEVIEKVSIPKNNLHNAYFYDAGIAWDVIGSDVTSNHIGKGAFTGDLFYPTAEGLYPITYARKEDNSDERQHTFYWLWKYNQSSAVTPKVIEWKVPHLSQRFSRYILNMTVKYCADNNIRNLSEKMPKDINLLVRLRNGNMYYHPEMPFNPWNSTTEGSMFTVTINKDTGKIKPNSTSIKEGFEFRTINDPYPGKDIFTLEIYLPTGQQLGQNAVIAFEDIWFEEIKAWNEGLFAEDFETHEYTLTSVTSSLEEDEYQLPISGIRYYKNFWQVDTNETPVFTIPRTAINAHFFIKKAFNPVQNFDTWIRRYIPKFSYWNSSLKWRIIAMSRHPIDDEVILKLKSIS